MKNKSNILTGIELLNLVVDKILDNPESWNQNLWHTPYGTQRCVAGWCQVLGGYPAISDIAGRQAQDLLDLSDLEAEWLFHWSRTLPEICLFRWFLNKPETEQDYILECLRNGDEVDLQLSNEELKLFKGSPESIYGECKNQVGDYMKQLLRRINNH